MIRDIILWKYERASWQWDLLCFLIILFIFLTPKAWFERREKLTNENLRPAVETVDRAAAAARR
ncbi:MAG: hypothetical protein JSS81_20725 [Acidobacteria bacterium]|nr:hypothetical protein [Acidobacteriota bacterium]